MQPFQLLLQQFPAKQQTKGVSPQSCPNLGRSGGGVRTTASSVLKLLHSSHTARALPHSCSSWRDLCHVTLKVFLGSEHQHALSTFPTLQESSVLCRDGTAVTAAQGEQFVSQAASLGYVLLPRGRNKTNVLEGGKNVA